MGLPGRGAIAARCVARGGISSAKAPQSWRPGYAPRIWGPPGYRLGVSRVEPDDCPPAALGRDRAAGQALTCQRPGMAADAPGNRPGRRDLRLRPALVRDAH